MHARREDTGRLQSYSRAVCGHVVCKGKQAQREVGQCQRVMMVVFARGPLLKMHIVHHTTAR